MKNVFTRSLASLVSLVALALNGAGAGDEVIVVYNARLPESKALAEYYAQRRHVPTNQLFGLNLSTNETISRHEYRDALEKPLPRRTRWVEAA